MKKKLILSLGTVAAIAAPIATIISCGSNLTVNQINNKLQKINIADKNTMVPDPLQPDFNYVKLSDWKIQLQIKDTGFLYVHKVTNLPEYRVVWAANDAEFKKELGPVYPLNSFWKIDVNKHPVLMYWDVQIALQSYKAWVVIKAPMSNIKSYLQNQKLSAQGDFKHPAVLAKGIDSTNFIHEQQKMVQQDHDAILHDNLGDIFLKALKPKYDYLLSNPVQNVLDPTK